MTTNPAAPAFDFVPGTVDYFQSPHYRLIGYRLEPDGALTAFWGSGATSPSIYRTVDELLAAGRASYLDRVRPVSPAAIALAARVR